MAEGNIFIRYYKNLAKNKWIINIIAILAVLLALVLALFIAYYIFSNSINIYSIKNKYYGFKIQTPKTWLGQERTVYSEDKVEKILEKCEDDRSNKATAYEIGLFRFASQEYPVNFGDLGYSVTGLSSGAIFEIKISCVPENIKSQIEHYLSSNIKVGGEKALEQFINFPQFGKTRYLSFFHKDLQYSISQYVYTSPNDEKLLNGALSEKLREHFNAVMDKIVSSFVFIK